MEEQSPTRRVLVAVVGGRRQRAGRNEDGKMVWWKMSGIWGRKIGEVLQGIGTAGRSLWRRPWLKSGCCANDDDDWIGNFFLLKGDIWADLSGKLLNWKFTHTTWKKKIAWRSEYPETPLHPLPESRKPPETQQIDLYHLMSPHPPFEQRFSLAHVTLAATWLSLPSTAWFSTLNWTLSSSQIPNM